MSEPISVAWRALVLSQKDALSALVMRPLFDEWDRRRMPEIMACVELQFGSESQFGGDPLGLAAQFLERALTICNRIVDEQKWLVGRCASRFPANRGLTHRVKAYSDGLQCGRSHLELLDQASVDYIEYSKQGPWKDDVAQYEFITGVICALAAGNWTFARAMLKTKKTFHYHLDLLALLRDIVFVEEGLQSRSNAVSRFDTYFNPWRKPDFKPAEYSEISLRRLDLAIVRQRLVTGSQGDIDWQGVVTSITS